MPFNRLHMQAWLYLAVLAIALFAGSCARTSSHLTNDVQGHNSGRAGVSENTSAERIIEKRIIEEFQRWKGVRHKMGGTGRSGVDCSGFVKIVYRNVFDIELPRTTRDQAKRGKPVSFRELQPGDLVFFHPPEYARHVGIYLSRFKFVHASKAKGVTVSKIDDSYWGRYYWTARRILPGR